MRMYLFILLLAIWPASGITGQSTCTLPGQTPVSAIPVCSGEPLSVSTPVFCGNLSVPVSCPGGFTYQNTNPLFFRIACYNTGTFGFLITPSGVSDNYDWQLFDITNRNPYDIFTAPSTFVACNWSSETGETGASTDGTDTVVCAGSGQNIFSRMPVIRQGRTYLLMVVNQSNAAGTFQLTVTGGSAVISDALDPKADLARANCDGRRIFLRMSKKITCNSIAADGSDFFIGPGINITGAFAADCSNLNSNDSLFIDLAQSLPNGTYNLTIVTGSDNNTLLDVCNKSVPAGQQISFTISGQRRTAIESVGAKPCGPDILLLQFSQPVQCSSILTDGSQFQLVNGPASATIQSAKGISCNNAGFTTAIELRLTAPVTNTGTYAVQLTAMGNPGNTLLDECGLAAENSIPLPSFTVQPGVNALFSTQAAESCEGTTYNFAHNGANNVNSWNWTFSNSGSSNQQFPSHTFTSSGNHQVTLVVTNGFCSDTVKSIVTSTERLKAMFETNAVICPGDPIRILNKTTGIADQWNWQFGNGQQSAVQSPSGIILNAGPLSPFVPVQLIATNSSTGCSDTARQMVQVLGSCHIVVPAAFTPNRDGLNDFFHPLNTEAVESLHFAVYNRNGQIVFNTSDKNGKWDGTVKGMQQDSGIYVWIFTYKLYNEPNQQQLKGTVMLIR